MKSILYAISALISFNINADTLKDVKDMTFIIMDWSENCTDMPRYSVAYNIKCPKYRAIVNIKNINKLKSKVNKSIKNKEYSAEEYSKMSDYLEVINIDINNKRNFIQ